MVDREGLVRKHSWISEYTIPTCFGGTEENHDNSIEVIFGGWYYDCLLEGWRYCGTMLYVVVSLTLVESPYPLIWNWDFTHPLVAEWNLVYVLSAVT